MLGRNRRVRFLAVFVVFALGILYYKSPGAGSLGRIREEAVGNIVVKEKTDGDSQARLQEPAPIPEAPIVENKVPVEEPVTTTCSSTSTTSTQAATTASSSTSPDAPAATHAPKVPLYEPDDDILAGGDGQGRFEMDAPVSSATSTLHWSKPTEHFPLSTTIQLPSGSSKPMPRLQNVDMIGGADEERLAIIKATAEHAWTGYKQQAWKADEIRPISGGKHNPFNGWGATLVDALDTLWIMGMKKEFEEAVEAVGEIDFTTSQRGDIPLFETTIRYLGGMIAAYDLSGTQYKVLLDKAVELAEVLYGAFDTPNRMPVTYPRWAPAYTSQPHRAGTRVVLAEIGSLSVEFTRLAQLTGEPKYYDAIARITDEFEAWQNDTRLPGMWPTYVDASGCGKPLRMDPYTTGTVYDAHDGSGRVEIAGPPIRGGESVLAAQQAEVNKQKQRQKTLDSVNGITADDIVPDIGSSKFKRQVPGSTAGTNERQSSAVNETLHHKDLRSPPDAINALTGQDPCIPQGISSPTKTGMEVFTLGGMSDSMYEYLPKEHMLLGGLTDQYRKMYVDSTDAAISKLLYRPMTPDNLDILFSGELRVRPNVTAGEMIEDHVADGAHLTCFAGGMFALGGVLFDRPEDVSVGAKLTDGCVWAYNVTATGIMPESFLTLACEDKNDCEWDEAKYWQKLDPYEETRTVIRDSYPNLPQVTPKTKKQTSVAETQATSTTTTPIAHAKVKVEKRQLDDVVGDAPEAPQPAKVPDPVRNLDPIVPPGPVTAPQLPDPKLQVQAPVYTPKPPLPHREYVKQKIADERLPPGMVRITSRNYILRPEAIESVFYMYRITGDQHWRDAGWAMFTAIHDHTQALYGNSAIDDVTKEAPEGKDSEESFWLAETLKYFYLLFDEPTKWSLDDWVLNTEAHFFRRPSYKYREDA